MNSCLCCTKKSLHPDAMYAPSSACRAAFIALCDCLVQYAALPSPSTSCSARASTVRSELGVDGHSPPKSFQMQPAVCRKGSAALPWLDTGADRAWGGCMLSNMSRTMRTSDRGRIASRVCGGRCSRKRAWSSATVFCSASVSFSEKTRNAAWHVKPSAAGCIVLPPPPVIVQSPTPGPGFGDVFPDFEKSSDPPSVIYIRECRPTNPDGADCPNCSGIAPEAPPPGGGAALAKLPHTPARRCKQRRWEVCDVIRNDL